MSQSSKSQGLTFSFFYFLKFDLLFFALHMHYTHLTFAPHKSFHFSRSGWTFIPK